ncbi:hypothetical protein J31TS4_08010 [Paenibacillus sp. J31TS4]|uniref:DUF2953 domain-containing protein n=1 Tax=Paenibacillus sp. J31TS4 TaxID=2807195 RepID=UPI001B072036|nr:DUF2953 domain-containing protein [Paenibacillus sp. J31TS4]GIP37521.1 hypothetical protein J31TS4_08010 [Paenibacillus sp. J31TS4]
MSIWWLVGGLLLFAAAAGVVLASRLRIKLYLSRQEKNDDLYMEIHALFGLVKRKVQVPKIAFKGWEKGWDIKTKSMNVHQPEKAEGNKELLTREKIRDWFDRFASFIENVPDYFGWLKETIAKFRCTGFSWNTHIGLGDAPETAMSVGAVWAIQSSLCGGMFHYLPLAEGTRPQLAVVPQYNELTFTTEVVCRLEIRVGTLLVAGMTLANRLLRMRKEQARQGSLTEA